MKFCELHGRPPRLLRMLRQQKHCQSGLKVSEMGQNEEKLSDFLDSTSKKRGGGMLINLLSCEYMLIFKTKEEWLRCNGRATDAKTEGRENRITATGWEVRPLSPAQRAEHQALENYSQAFSLMELVLLGFGLTWNQWRLYFFQFLLIRMLIFMPVPALHFRSR